MAGYATSGKQPIKAIDNKTLTIPARQVNQQQAIQQIICQYLPVQQGRAVNWANLRTGLLEWHNKIVEQLIESS